MAKPIDRDRLVELLDYDANTGIFTRKSFRGRCPAGSAAGYQRTDGYVVIKYDDSVYKAHRLAYVYAHGAIPDGCEIDHINGVCSDNRIANLRAVVHAQNMQNQRRPRRDSKTGVRGVQKYRAGAYVAQITLNGEPVYLGCRKTLEEATALRDDAERRLFPFSPLSAPATAQKETRA